MAYVAFFSARSFSRVLFAGGIPGFDRPARTARLASPLLRSSLARYCSDLVTIRHLLMRVRQSSFNATPEIRR